MTLDTEVLPSGTVTFLFTDLEGSTRLWQKHPDAMPGALSFDEAVDRILAELDNQIAAASARG